MRSQPLLVKRSCGISRFIQDTQYNCTINSIEIYPSELHVYIEARGNNSRGALQNPELSKLYCNGRRVNHRQWASSIQTDVHIVGNFIYDGNNFKEGDRLDFEFGERGYQRVEICRSVPMGMSGDGFSINLGGFTISSRDSGLSKGTHGSNIRGNYPPRRYPPPGPPSPGISYPPSTVPGSPTPMQPNHGYNAPQVNSNHGGNLRHVPNHMNNHMHQGFNQMNAPGFHQMNHMQHGYPMGLGFPQPVHGFQPNFNQMNPGFYQGHFQQGIHVNSGFPSAPIHQFGMNNGYPQPMNLNANQGWNPNINQAHDWQGNGSQRNNLSQNDQPRKLQKSHNWGTRTRETRSFDNVNQIPTTVPFPIRSVKVWGNAFVNGIQVMYSTGSTPIEVGTKNNPAEHCMNLSTGEYITSVSGRYGSWIDSIEIRTNHGRILRVGGNGGSKSYSFQAPPGHAVVGFFGGVGGHLHNIGFYSAPL
eukprot:TRINITY_DN931_c1_g1_i1.p1 TRINITY_DN931_c1_g1~~TRINITY_DN931_c1_g1_i1.p1  ORF type:complete len:473 (-),score=73.63 TRINITY_DN931_c1_g1_i1:58-1476(-)